MLRKLTVIAILIALLISAFPTTGVLAAGGTEKQLEKKWDQLLTNFDRQMMGHQKAHKWVEAWLKNDTKATAAEKTEVARHLATCNTALETAQGIVARHAGFNANGKVTNMNLAYKSIKELSNALRAHVASIKNITEHAK